MPRRQQFAPSVYALRRGGIPFYVGRTSKPRKRAAEHQNNSRIYTGIDDCEFVVLASYSTNEAAKAGEIIAWESFARLGFELRNERPDAVDRTSPLTTTREERSEWGRRGCQVRVACPRCQLESNPGGMGSHRKATGH